MPNINLEYFFFNNLTINKIEGQDNGTEVSN